MIVDKVQLKLRKNVIQFSIKNGKLEVPMKKYPFSDVVHFDMTSELIHKVDVIITLKNDID